MLTRPFILLTVLMTCAVASANAAEPVMNDIKLGDYADFEQKWPLITVRYRTDTTEMRFTYANPAAEAVLKAGGTDYPDGAVFAKIGLMTADDPEFISSKVPSGAKRFQFMVRDKAKYAATGGWGYAVFGAAQDANALTHMPKEDAATIQACFACHEMVQHRGYVFSQPANLRAAYTLLQANAVAPKPIASPLQFVDYDLKSLPDAVRDFLPKDTKKIRFLDGKLRAKVFVGTFGEIRPTLIKESAQTSLPTIFMDASEQKFILVFPDDKTVLPDGKACPAGQKAYTTHSSESFSNIGNHFCA